MEKVVSRCVTVTTVVDGKNGTSPYLADLSNQMDSVRCHDNGTTISQQTVQTTPSFFHGSSPVSLSVTSVKRNGSTISGSSSPVSYTYSGGVITITYQSGAQVNSSTMKDDIAITLTASDGSSTQMTLHLYVNAVTGDVYNLKPNVSEISVGRTDAGGYNPSTFNLYCGYTRKDIDGNITDVANISGTIDSKYYVYYRRRTRSTQLYENYLLYSSNKSYLSSLDVTTFDSVQFVMCTGNPSSASTSIIDIEDVPVVSDGRKGDNGGSVNTITKYFQATVSETPPTPASTSTTGWTQGTTPSDWGENKRYLWCQEKTILTDNTTTLWSEVYLDSVWGQKGGNGKDGWMVTADPANVIITQNLDNTSSFNSATVSFSAKKGNNDVAISSLGTLTRDRFLASKSGKTVVVTSPDNYQGTYFTEGSFTVEVNVTDPDTSNTVTFTVKVLCYANLLGTWKQSVENGTETIVANKIVYTFGDSKDPNRDTVDEVKYDFNSVRDASYSYQEWARTDNTSTGSKTYINTHLATAEQNITTIQQSVGKNLLDCSDGEGWREYTGNALSTFDSSTQKVTSTDTYSTAVLLKEGVTYTFSVYANTRPTVSRADCSGDPNIDYRYAHVEGNISMSVVSGDTYLSCNRYQGTFTPSYSDYYKFNVYSISYMYRPQLEVGSSATSWVPGGVKNQTSEIKQTADSVELSVKDGLNQSGINIDAHTVNLYGDKVTFSDKNGGNTDKVWIDPDKGTLHAENGVFTGSLLFHKLLTSGLTISESGYSLFKMYSSGGSEIPMSNRSTRVEKITLSCDVFVLTGSKRDYTIYLPPAKLFPYAEIEIINGTYSGGSGNAVTDNPSQITLSVFYPYNIDSSIKETFNEQDGSYVSNCIISGIPFKYQGFTGSGYTNMAFTGVFESNRAVIGSYGSWIESCGIVCGQSDMNYKRIRLISAQNNYLSTKTYWAWMIVEAVE